jgi:hypothetical protein
MDLEALATMRLLIGVFLIDFEERVFLGMVDDAVCVNMDVNIDAQYEYMCDYL